MSKRVRNFMLNCFWNLKVYSATTKVFQNKNETLLLTEDNKILCNIKSLKNNRISFKGLSDEVFCELENGIVHFSEINPCGFQEFIEDSFDVNTEDIVGAKKILSTGITICEICLGKCLALNNHENLILIAELIEDEEIIYSEKSCDTCGRILNCLALSKCEIVEDYCHCDEYCHCDDCCNYDEYCHCDHCCNWEEEYNSENNERSKESESLIEKENVIEEKDLTEEEELFRQEEKKEEL